MMFRSVSRSAGLLSGRLGRETTAKLRSNLAPERLSRLAFSTDSRKTYASLSESQSAENEPVPLPALAYAYDDYDYDDELDEGTEGVHEGNKPLGHQGANGDVNHDVMSSDAIQGAFHTSSGPTGRGPTSSTPYPPPSSIISTKAGATRKVGGGTGGSRHRCPKCGTTVTFRCDYEENTFYCASCSGWFVINPNTVLAHDQGKENGSPYEEFMARNETRVEEPEILMRHVSDVFFCREFLRWTELIVFFCRCPTKVKD